LETVPVAPLQFDILNIERKNSGAGPFGHAPFVFLGDFFQEISLLGAK
jgi:hypothetical protein